MRALTRSLHAGLRPSARPDKALRAHAGLRRWGPTPAAACHAAAVWRPHKTAIIDDQGAESFAELDQRTSALANALGARGLTARDTVAVMCRNHRAPVEALIACSKLGLNLVHLDPELTTRESERILRRAATGLLIHDEEFDERLRLAPRRCERMIARTTTGARPGAHLLEELLGQSPTSPPKPVPSSIPREVTFSWPHNGRRPRKRTIPGSLLTPGVISSRMPLRERRTTMICAPLSRPWGHLHLLLALRLGSTILLHDQFDPLQALASIDEHKPDALALLPDMLEEILSLPRETLAWYDTSAVRVIAVREPHLAGELAIPAIAYFGATLYSLRGPSIVAISPQGDGSHVALAGPTRAL